MRLLIGTLCVLFSWANNVEAGSAKVEPLECYLPGDSLHYRAKDFTYIGPAYSFTGYSSNILFRFTDDFAKRLYSFEEKNSDKLAARLLFDDLIAPVVGLGVGMGEKKTEWYSFDLSGLSEIFSMSDPINALRADPDKQDTIVVTDFVSEARFTVAEAKVAKMAYFELTHSINMQPIDETFARTMLETIGHRKTDWRCFVGGREASGWELDENRSPPAFHFKLK